MRCYATATNRTTTSHCAPLPVCPTACMQLSLNQIRSAVLWHTRSRERLIHPRDTQLTVACFTLWKVTKALQAVMPSLPPCRTILGTALPSGQHHVHEHGESQFNLPNYQLTNRELCRGKMAHKDAVSLTG